MVEQVQEMTTIADQNDYQKAVEEIQELVNTEPTDMFAVLERCESAIEMFKAEYDVREANGALESWTDRDEVYIDQIFHYAGLTAFELAQDDDTYLERAEMYFNTLPDGVSTYAHLTLARIYLYNEELDLALFHLEYHAAIIEDLDWMADNDTETIQSGREYSALGFAVIHFARGDHAKFFEHFDLYLDLVKQNGGVPVNKHLILLNFLPYFELHAENLIFLEKMLLFCPLMEEFLGVKYELWVQSEQAFEARDYPLAYALAREFKASHAHFFEMSGDSFETGWQELKILDDGTESDSWASAQFLHPAMANYEHIPIGERVDARLDLLLPRI